MKTRHHLFFAIHDREWWSDHGAEHSMVAALISNIFGIPPSFVLEAGLILSWIMLFTISVYSGLRSGMKFITNFRFWFFMGLFMNVVICGPTSFIFKSTLECAGTQFQIMIARTTYTSAVDGTKLSADWTVSCFAWFVAAAIVTGIYYAQVCCGRTNKRASNCWMPLKMAKQETERLKMLA